MILSKIRSKRENSQTTMADIKRIVAAYESGDWSEVIDSKLYREHSGEYCELLEYINMPEWLVGVVMPTFVDQRYIRDRDLEIAAPTAEDAKRKWFEHMKNWIREDEKHLVKVVRKGEELK
ncbi:hypothetical protein MHB81_21740 [Paenibacillus sp. FSL H7-0326]